MRSLFWLLGAIAVVAGCGRLYALIRLLGHALSLPAYVRSYRARRRRERAHAALSSALQAYYEGRYSRAEKEAAVAFEGGSAPALAALLAARSAHQLRDFQRRDRWLHRADAQGERMHSASLATRAELALEDRDFATARDALRNLHSVRPKQIATTRMLLRAERGAGAWDEVLRLATQLGKRDAIAPALAEEYKVQAMVELLGRSAADEGAFERRWRGIEAKDRVHPRIAVAAARHANQLGKGSMAREILERALAAEWSPPLVGLYAELPAEMGGEAKAAEAPAPDGSRAPVAFTAKLPAEMGEEAKAAEARERIERAESWLLEHARDAQLLATLGRLCAHAGLWGKARSFLEASVSFEETRSGYLELAGPAEPLAQVRLRQRGVDALLGHVDAADFPAYPGGVPPHARPARGLHEPGGNVAQHLAAQAGVELGEVVDPDVGLCIGVGDLAEKHRIDAVPLSDALRGIRIELIASHRGEHRLAAAELDKPRSRLRCLDLLLELLRRARAAGAARVGREIDHAERTVPLQIDARRHADKHRAGAPVPGSQ